MNTVNTKISRGEVYYIKSIYPAVGSEQRSGRPAVIVSNNLNNEHSKCVEICYLTLQEKTPLPTHVLIDRGECENSTILCEQVTTVSTERLGDYMCRVPDDIMDKVDKALVVSLGLDYLMSGEDNSNKTSNFDSKDAQIKELMHHLDCTRKELELAKEANATIKEKAANAIMYERMYNDILERLTRR